MWKKAQGTSLTRSAVLESPGGTLQLPLEVPSYMYCEYGGGRIVGMLYSHNLSLSRVTYLVGATHQVSYNYATGVVSNPYGTCYFPS